MEKKMVIVPFDVEMAKKITNGKVDGKIVTRDERNARIICFDAHCDDNIVALIEDEKGVEYIRSYVSDGMTFLTGECDCDLMLEIPEYMTFKDGDVIAYDGFDTISITMADVIRNVNDVFAHYYAELRNGKLHFYEEGVRDVLNVGARFATEEEKQKLIDSLKESKDPEAKECLKMLGIEIKPKCELKPFDKVLVRNFDYNKWSADIFSHIDIDGDMHECVGGIWNFCIHYNEKTAHLLGTTDNWEEEK